MTAMDMGPATWESVIVTQTMQANHVPTGCVQFCAAEGASTPMVNVCASQAGRGKSVNCERMNAKFQTALVTETA